MVVLPLPCVTVDGPRVFSSTKTKARFKFQIQSSLVIQYDQALFDEALDLVRNASVLVDMYIFVD